MLDCSLRHSYRISINSRIWQTLLSCLCARARATPLHSPLLSPPLSLAPSLYPARSLSLQTKSTWLSPTLSLPPSLKLSLPPSISFCLSLTHTKSTWGISRRSDRSRVRWRGCIRPGVRRRRGIWSRVCRRGRVGDLLDVWDSFLEGCQHRVHF